MSHRVAKRQRKELRKAILAGQFGEEARELLKKLQKELNGMFSAFQDMKMLYQKLHLEYQILREERKNEKR